MLNSLTRKLPRFLFSTPKRLRLFGYEYLRQLGGQTISRDSRFYPRNARHIAHVAQVAKLLESGMSRDGHGSRTSEEEEERAKVTEELQATVATTAPILYLIVPYLPSPSKLVTLLNFSSQLLSRTTRMIDPPVQPIIPSHLQAAALPEGIYTTSNKHTSNTEDWTTGARERSDGVTVRCWAVGTRFKLLSRAFDSRVSPLLSQIFALFHPLFGSVNLSIFFFHFGYPCVCLRSIKVSTIVFLTIPYGRKRKQCLLTESMHRGEPTEDK